MIESTIFESKRRPSPVLKAFISPLTDEFIEPVSIALRIFKLTTEVSI